MADTRPGSGRNTSFANGIRTVPDATTRVSGEPEFPKEEGSRCIVDRHKLRAQM
jgi:hypothetical protein